MPILIFAPLSKGCLIDFISETKSALSIKALFAPLPVKTKSTKPGLKEKVLAAHRAGVKTIIAPENNEKDLEDIPENVKKDLNFVFVKNIDEVLNIALTRPPQPAPFKVSPKPIYPALA